MSGIRIPPTCVWINTVSSSIWRLIYRWLTIFRALYTTSSNITSKWHLNFRYVLHHPSFITRFVEECDGFVYASAESYEQEAIHHTREWLKESGNRQFYVIGPMLPPGIGQLPPAGAPLLESEYPSRDTEFWQFMDKVLDTHGINSLVYVGCTYAVCISFSIVSLSSIITDILRKFVVAER